MRFLPAVFLVALLWRLPGLGVMPFHVDEANNALLLDEALSAGWFQYRPVEHHGPTLFYLAGAFCGVFGVDSAAGMEEWMLRAVAVVCGALAAASVLLLSPYWPGFRVLAAALIVAVAAPFHYYSRVFIHESLLLLLAVWLLAALFRWRDSGGLVWAVVCGVVAGLMVATKENAAVSVLLIGWPFLLPGSRIRAGGLCVAGFFAAAVVLCLIGPGDLCRAVVLHVRRGFDSGHDWPWYQFFYWFGSCRGPGWPWGCWVGLLLAVVAVVKEGRGTVVLFLGLIGLLLFHSLLPYKTPWLMLVPFLLLSLLAAAGLEVLFRWLPLFAGVLAVGLVFVLLGVETWQRSFSNQVRADNPLAYAPTDFSAVDLVRDLDVLGRRDAVVQVVAEDYWPLPWLLRKYRNTGFWRQAPERWCGEVLVCSPKALGWVPDVNGWRFSLYVLRPGVLVFVGRRVDGGAHD